MSKDCVLDSIAFLVIVSASVESESSLSISTCLRVGCHMSESGCSFLKLVFHVLVWMFLVHWFIGMILEYFVCVSMSGLGYSLL